MIKKTFRFLGASQASGKEQTAMAEETKVAEVANEHEDVSTLCTMEHGSHQDSSIEKYKEGIAILKQAFPTFPEHEIANFLEYHDGKVEAAREKMTACIRWREANLPIDPEAIKGPRERGLFYFHGTDLEGRPLAYFSLKSHDKSERDVKQYIKAVVYESERQEARMGSSDYHITIVIDRRDMGLAAGDLDMFKAFFKTFAELYPMKLYRVIIFPAAAMTRLLWRMLRPFLHPHVQRKLVLASNSQEVFHYVAKEQLLTSLGGEDDYDYRQDI